MKSDDDGEEELCRCRDEDEWVPVTVSGPDLFVIPHAETERVVYALQLSRLHTLFPCRTMVMINIDRNLGKPRIGGEATLPISH